MYKTILVPIDIAHMENGKSMIELAKNYGDEDTRIILLNVIEEVPNWIAAQLPTGIMESSRKSTQAEMQGIAGDDSDNIHVEIRSGHASRTILETAEKEGVDLIVIASHKPGLQDYFLGSTAAKVVRHAHCSVLVVR
jgi:nucleotide-binding universal stress UspA family protein